MILVVPVTVTLEKLFPVKLLLVLVEDAPAICAKITEPPLTGLLKPVPIVLLDTLQLPGGYTVALLFINRTDPLLLILRLSNRFPLMPTDTILAREKGIIFVIKVTGEEEAVL
jgi:hypothetical protein